jgi:hypothetical protein
MAAFIDPLSVSDAAPVVELVTIRCFDSSIAWQEWLIDDVLAQLAILAENHLGARSQMAACHVARLC